MSKKEFNKLLEKAIFSPSTPQRRANSGGYSGKRTHQRNVGGISPKRRDKSRPKSVCAHHGDSHLIQQEDKKEKIEELEIPTFKNEEKNILWPIRELFIKINEIIKVVNER